MGTQLRQFRHSCCGLLCDDAGFQGTDADPLDSFNIVDPFQQIDQLAAAGIVSSLLVFF